MTPSGLRDHPIFICGHPKAGTSLLRAVFDSHPQLVVYPEETIFFRRFLPRAAGQDLSGLVALAETNLIHIFRWNRDNPDPSQAGFPDRDYSAIPYERVRNEMQRLAAEQNRHPGDILSAAVLAYGLVCGQAGPETRAWVEKSPYNEFYARQIFEWWPQARCVHIVRDPRDNFVSYRRKHPDWSAEFFAANWRRSTQAGLNNLNQFGPSRYLILRYENLTSTPDQHLSQLIEFLGIDWNAALAAPTRAGEQWQGNSMFAERFQQISAAPVARWREQLDPGDAATIEHMAAPVMQRLNYPAGSFARPARLSAAWRAASWPIRRRFIRPIKSHLTSDDRDG